MSMVKIKFEIPEEILYSLNKSASDFAAQMRLLTALQLFKDHKLSLGKAAELSGLNKEGFIFELDRYKIPTIDYDAAELDEELLRLENAGHS